MKCNCPCHQPGNIIMHCVPCCYPGKGSTSFKITLSEKWVKDDDLTLGQLIAGTDPYKEDAPINIFLQDEVGQWQSLPDRMKDTQEEYNKLLNDLNEETPPT